MLITNRFHINSTPTHLSLLAFSSLFSATLSFSSGLSDRIFFALILSFSPLSLFVSLYLFLPPPCMCEFFLPLKLSFLLSDIIVSPVLPFSVCLRVYLSSCLPAPLPSLNMWLCVCLCALFAFFFFPLPLFHPLSLSFSLSISLSLLVSLSLCDSLSPNLSISPLTLIFFSNHPLSLSLSVCLSVCLSLSQSLSLSLSVSLSVCLSLSLSLSPPPSLSYFLFFFHPLVNPLLFSILSTFSVSFPRSDSLYHFSPSLLLIHPLFSLSFPFLSFSISSHRTVSFMLLTCANLPYLPLPASQPATIESTTNVA